VLGLLVMVVVVTLEPTITSPGGVVPRELIVVVAVVPLLPLQTGQANFFFDYWWFNRWRICDPSSGSTSANPDLQR
jgi:hypothetical protein